MASRFIFEAIGTKWRIDIADSLSPERESFVLEQIHERIAVYDMTYSRFRTDSVVTRMSREAGTYPFPEDSQKLFSLYKTFYDITRGKVTPLIGDVLIAAGYDAAYSLIQKEPLVAPLAWDSVFSYEPYTLTIHTPAMLDIGAGGKGYLVDIIGELLEKNALTSYTIDAGGDIRHRGENILRVGLENPFDTSEVVGIATITNQSICGSAGSRRTWGAFHHIIDPETLQSPQEIAAVWVVAENTFLADMLTTALFFLPPEEMLLHFSFEYVMLLRGMEARSSEKFPGELFTV